MAKHLLLSQCFLRLSAMPVPIPLCTNSRFRYRYQSCNCRCNIRCRIYGNCDVRVLHHDKVDLRRRQSHPNVLFLFLTLDRFPQSDHCQRTVHNGHHGEPIGSKRILVLSRFQAAGTSITPSATAQSVPIRLARRGCRFHSAHPFDVAYSAIALVQS